MFLGYFLPSLHIIILTILIIINTITCLYLIWVIKKGKFYHYRIIENEETPEEEFKENGWNKIMNKFIDGDDDCAYIQLNNEEELNLAVSAFNSSLNGLAKKIKITPYEGMLRVYLEKPSSISYDDEPEEEIDEETIVARVRNGDG